MVANIRFATPMKTISRFALRYYTWHWTSDEYRENTHGWLKLKVRPLTFSRWHATLCPRTGFCRGYPILRDIRGPCAKPQLNPLNLASFSHPSAISRTLTVLPCPSFRARSKFRVTASPRCSSGAQGLDLGNRPYDSVGSCRRGVGL